MRFSDLEKAETIGKASDGRKSLQTIPIIIATGSHEKVGLEFQHSQRCRDRGLLGDGLRENGNRDRERDHNIESCHDSDSQRGVKEIC